MRVAAIIQARMGSSRLPGKVTQEIAGRPMLARVVERVMRFRNCHRLAIATSKEASDDAILELGRRLGVDVFRGSEHDVLRRYADAAGMLKADVCVRITSDCPLIDPDVSDQIIAAFLGADPPVDYASNKIPQSFPRGLDTEVFSREALERANRDAVTPHQRAHVCPYLYENSHLFRLLSITSDVHRSDWRWTVDTMEDLAFVRAIFDRLGLDGHFGWLDVVALLEREPALRAINAHVSQKAIWEG